MRLPRGRYRTAYWRRSPFFNYEIGKMDERWELWVHRTRWWTLDAALRWARSYEVWESLVDGKPAPHQVVVRHTDLQDCRAPVIMLGEREKK